MKPLTDAIGSQLFWEQPKVSQRSYLLRSQDDTFAHLDFRSAFAAAANASSGDENWIIKQMGFFADRVSVHSVDSEVELIGYQPDWMGTSGEIQFSTGELYTWNVTNYVASRFSISKADQLELITYLSRARRRKFSNLFKQQAQVVISPVAWQIKELPILILLGWYLALRHHEDAAVLAATASLGVLY